MITAPTYQGKTVAVFGLARTGLAAVETLVASGATVWAWDDDMERVKAVGAVAKNLYDADFTCLDALMLAPGVPLTHPSPHSLVTKAKANHVPIIGDLDIFQAARATLPKHHVVAITGTNGKSTTSALVTHILKSAGRPVALGGNIGTGVLSLSALPKGGIYVFEVSSFQIDLMVDFKPDIAALLNITPDHLDRHGTMEAYVLAKKRLFDLMGAKGRAVIAQNDAYTKDIAVSVDATLVALPSALDMADCPTLNGAHNAQNAKVAYAIAASLGLSDADIVAGLKSFPGLVHRQQHLATIDGVLYVNDSKATNVDAAATALSSFKNIHWIAGGRSKEKGLQGIFPYLTGVKHAYLIGEAAADFSENLMGKIAFDMCGTLDNALMKARKNAKQGDVILLSPACSAFDQFQNFEVRGDHFISLVKQLMKGEVHHVAV